MAIKNSILSSVNRAVSSNTQTPQERKQENLLTSINSNMRKVVKNGNKAIRDDKQKIHTKLLTGVRNTLDKIKKNTKPDSKGFGILKILLMIVGGLIIGATTKLFNTVKIFTKIIGFFGKIIKGFGSILSGGFTKLFGRLLKGPKALLLGFFGMFKKLGGIFKGPKALVLKLIGFFKSFGGIFKLLGKIGIFLAPVTMIVKKLVWPITLLMYLFDGLKGL